MKILENNVNDEINHNVEMGLGGLALIAIGMYVMFRYTTLNGSLPAGTIIGGMIILLGGVMTVTFNHRTKTIQQDKGYKTWLHDHNWHNVNARFLATHVVLIVAMIGFITLFFI